MTQAYIRPELLYGWRGQTQLVVSTFGTCGAEYDLSGFYFRETRYLRTLAIELNGQRPWLCEAATEEPDLLRFSYVYPELTQFGGGGSGQSGDEVTTDEHGVPYRSQDVRLTYRLRPATLEATLEVTNRSLREVSFDIAWVLGADFADIQEAQGGQRQQRGAVATAESEDALDFIYGHPELPYRTRASASGGQWRHDAGQAGEDGARSSARLVSTVRLSPGGTARVVFVVAPHDYRDPCDEAGVVRREQRWRAWRDGMTRIAVPANTSLQSILARNIRDVASFPLLAGEECEWLAPQAGIPAYPALFGRDALTAGWQGAMLDRGGMLDASLTVLGARQTDRVDDWHDEEPGRIPFQIRDGPLARLGLNPFAAYYADFASPLMFVVALAHLYSWTGDRQHIARHWDTVRRICEWARTYGDADGDGYLEYETKSKDGPKNQGWKDSGRAVLYEDGAAVPSPVATCELQGYWFAAQQMMAVLSLVMGERSDARDYWSSAAELKTRFNRDWWIEETSAFALAMDPDKRLVRAVTSNVGHCIASGIVDEEHLPATVGRLFAPDMFSGWGIRTLSSEHVAYNPISYHLGSVWAVEQATIAFGLRRFGFDVRAQELAGALFDCAALYPESRIPECIGGYARGVRPVPSAYPRANTPQLWNATAFPLLVHALLGLQPVAPLSLLVVDPVLPTWMPEVVLRDLRLGDATATLRFWRDDGGTSHAEIVRRRGTLRLVKQPPLESLRAGFTDRFGALADSVIHH